MSIISNYTGIEIDLESAREDVCAICLADGAITVAVSGRRWVVVKGDKDAVVARCGHAFHRRCLDDWLNANATADRKCFICQEATWLDDLHAADSYLSRIQDLAYRLYKHPEVLRKPLLNTAFFAGATALITAFDALIGIEIDPMETASMAATLGSLAGIAHGVLLRHPVDDEAFEEQLTIGAVEGSHIFVLASQFAFRCPSFCHYPWLLVPCGSSAWALSSISVKLVLQHLFYLRNQQAIDNSMSGYAVVSGGGIILGWVLQQLTCATGA